jgi:hypothetical protein
MGGAPAHLQVDRADSVSVFSDYFAPGTIFTPAIANYEFRETPARDVH